MSSRAERRRQARRPNPSGPRRRDPMTPIYIGMVVAIALVLCAFLLWGVKKQHDVAVASATPTPGPNASQSPIPLKDGMALGKRAFPRGDNPGGGYGSPVDDIQCQTMEQAAFHIHSHVALFVKGQQLEIPALIGILPQAGQICLYWIHTHDASGIIHIEAPEFRNYVLGNFFDIWGQQLSRNEVGPYHGPVTAFVNGEKYDGDPNQIPLTAHQQITLEVGTPVVPPPNYKFPPND